MGLHSRVRWTDERQGERTMDDYEREIINRILEKHAGNISRTALELNLSRQTLYRKIRKFGLQSGIATTESGHDL